MSDLAHCRLGEGIFEQNLAPLDPIPVRPSVMRRMQSFPSSSHVIPSLFRLYLRKSAAAVVSRNLSNPPQI